MKNTVTESQFIDSFGTGDYANNFSYDAKRAIFAYLEELEEDCGVEFELDPIAVCCDYSEHASGLECISDMGYDFEPEEEDDEDEQEVAALEYLRENTSVIEFDGGIIIQGF